MSKANYVTVGRKPKDGKNPKIPETLDCQKKHLKGLRDWLVVDVFLRKRKLQKKHLSFIFLIWKKKMGSKCVWE